MESGLYTRGFNHGYILSKYKSKLVAKLLKAIEVPISEYAIGFNHGNGEYESEKLRKRKKDMGIIKNKKDINKEDRLDSR